jgi:hypothetical protein
MPVRSAAERLARQAALKSKLQAAPRVQVLPPLPVLAGRSPDGKFLPGNRISIPGQGRPRDKLIELAQRLHNKYRLMEVVAEMASRKGRYAKIDYPTQLRAAMYLTERAYGPAPASAEIIRSEDGGPDRIVCVTKRLVGIDPDSV